MLLEFVVTALICGVGVVSAQENDRNYHRDNRNNGHYDDRGNGRHSGRSYHSHEYRGRAYLPPPVIYAPPPPPGIGIFFPPIFIHP